MNNQCVEKCQTTQNDENDETDSFHYVTGNAFLKPSLDIASESVVCEYMTVYWCNI